MIEVSPELLAFLKEEYDRCRDETLDDERTTAIDRYNGKPYGDEDEGRSQVVARDTAETVDYMVISILRTIISGDDVVEFVHRDADKAHEVTQTIKHLFMDEQDGYSTLHDWLKAGLLEKNSVAMTYGEPQPPKRKLLQGVSAMAMMVMEQQGAKIVEAEETGEVSPEEGPIYNLTIMEERPIKFCDGAVANEEFYCSPDARTITEAPIKGRKRARPIYELVAEGIRRDELESLGVDGYCDNTLSPARDDNRNAEVGARSGLARKVWWHEEYARFDENGDGIAELLYIRRTGDFKIFSIDEMEDEDDHPFEDWCPFPMQHRRIGQSLFDKTGDLERINTVLLRQSLDGIYTANNPSTYVHEDAIGENTIEDLLTVRPGRIVRWKGATAPVERQGAFDAANGFTMMEFIERKRESRTGITRLNMGLDEKTLNDTARGQAQLIAKGEQVEEYVARNFVNAVSRLFTKKAKMLKRYGEPMMIPIDGKYVQVDPSQWPDDLLARPRVGLGSSRKDQRLLFRQQIGEMQMIALQNGLRIVGEKQFYNTGRGMAADMGLDASEFFVDPDEMPPQEPQPDPEMAKVQGEMQMKAAELQGKQQEAVSKLQLSQAENAAKIELAREEAAAKIQAMREEAQLKAQLERDKALFEAQQEERRFQAELQMNERRMQMEERLAERNAQRAERESEAKMKTLRKGGNLSK